MTTRPRDGFADTVGPDNLARTGAYAGAKEEAQSDENYDEEKEKLEKPQ